MKICEWENVRCPYCGESDQEKFDPAEFCACEITWGKISIPGHRVLCGSCGGTFAVTCED